MKDYTITNKRNINKRNIDGLFPSPLQPRSPLHKTARLLMVFLCSSVFIFSSANAAEQTPIELNGVGIEENLGAALSLDIPFIDEEGKTVTLQHFLDGTHPILLSFVYYGCPNLCNLLMNGATEMMKAFSWGLGDRYQMVFVSIDPKETPEFAAQKKASHMEALGKPEASKGWHFLTGREEDIQRLADQAGFRYRYDEKQGQYAHAASIIALTPHGKITRYLYGVQFSVKDVKLALLEASAGKVGNVVDKILLYCYHYDPQGRRYALAATNMMKGAGAATVVGLGLFLTFLVRNKRRKIKYDGNPAAL